MRKTHGIDPVRLARRRPPPIAIYPKSRTLIQTPHQWQLPHPHSSRDIRPISRHKPLVNVLAPPKARLSVEIVYDLICPWCYLGVRRLLRTFRRRPDLLFDLNWRPFLLNPDMPRTGMARPDYVIRKFGGEDRAKRLYASITELGRREGVAFAFERIRRTPSSIDAHRLVRFAARYDRADAMVEALFSVHFSEGYDIGDRAVLLALASACGLDTQETKAFLASDEEADAVHADNLRAHRLGINGVPCFVIGGRHAIAGAQEPEVIERLLDVAAVDATEL
jgi:predicted DsbA family dithiol-disulfide isomerase